MKRIETFQADDGKIFDTEQECLAHEASIKEDHKIEALIMTFTSDFSLQLKFARFFQEYKEDIRKIFVAKTKYDAGWISNENNNSCFPPIDDELFIEIQKRDGHTSHGRANDWSLCWRSTDNDPSDIVKYRIING